MEHKLLNNSAISLQNLNRITSNTRKLIMELLEALVKWTVRLSGTK